jgi:glycosyltransferase involved in cell wall biosynthesis
VAGNGDEAYVHGLHHLAAECGLSDHVRFLGFVSGEEKRRVLREA